jgi:hypothetical protein
VFYRDILGCYPVELLAASREAASAGLGAEDASLKVAEVERRVDSALELIEYSVPEGRKMIAPAPRDAGCMHMAFVVLQWSERTSRPGDEDGDRRGTVRTQET